MNIYQKLIEVRKAVPYLKKEASGHQYNYVGSSQVLAAVRQKMDELGLLLIPEVVSKTVTMDTVENTDKYNNIKRTTTYFTELEMKFTWVNAENPEEKIVCPWYGQGVDIAGEKGVGKAMTYAEKYFLLKQFNIATDKDDPDAFQQNHGMSQSAPQPQKQNTKQDASSQLASEQMKKTINGLVKNIGMQKPEWDEILTTLGIKDYAQITKAQADKLFSTISTYKKGDKAGD